MIAVCLNISEVLTQDLHQRFEAMSAPKIVCNPKCPKALLRISRVFTQASTNPVQFLKSNGGLHNEKLVPTDFKGPLVQFQATKTNKDDTQKLMHTINQALKDEALPDEQLDKAFEHWWPNLERCIENIPEARTKIEPTRSDREILEELLELVRRLIRGRSPCKTVVVKPSKEVTVDQVSEFVRRSKEEKPEEGDKVYIR
jgi:hypothetical protein